MTNALYIYYRVRILSRSLYGNREFFYSNKYCIIPCSKAILGHRKV